MLMRDGRKARPRERTARGSWRTIMNCNAKYTGWGLALGAALGAAFGVAAGHIGVWLAVGVAVGMALGYRVRAKGAACPQCEAMHRTHPPAGRQ